MILVRTLLIYTSLSPQDKKQVSFLPYIYLISFWLLSHPSLVHYYHYTNLSISYDTLIFRVSCFLILFLSFSRYTNTINKSIASSNSTSTSLSSSSGGGPNGAFKTRYNKGGRIGFIVRISDTRVSAYLRSYCVNVSIFFVYLYRILLYIYSYKPFFRIYNIR